jgi:hypothetical protein
MIRWLFFNRSDDLISTDRIGDEFVWLIIDLCLSVCSVCGLAFRNAWSTIRCLIISIPFVSGQGRQTRWPAHAIRSDPIRSDPIQSNVWESKERHNPDKKTASHLCVVCYTTDSAPFLCSIMRHRRMGIRDRRRPAI